MQDKAVSAPTAAPLAAYWTTADLPAMPPFLHALVAQATGRLHVAKIVVFGSRARADCTPTSDYDVAFFLEDAQGWTQFVADQHESAATLLPLDLINVDEVSAELRHEIVTFGVTIYAQSSSPEFAAESPIRFEPPGGVSG